MERIAWLVIGAALAVVVMTLLPLASPADRIETISAGPQAEPTAMAGMTQMTGASGMAGMEAMHQHPPREVSPDLPVPGVTHLMFPDVMDGYNVQILPRNFTFTPAKINRAPEFNEGHAHVYVNGVKLSRVYSTWFHLPGA